DKRTSSSESSCGIEPGRWAGQRPQVAEGAVPMKVLFFAEPFPIRNSFTQFGYIAQRVAALIKQGTGQDLRLYANEATLATIAGDVLADLRHRIVKPRSFNSNDHWPEVIAWDGEGIGQWTKLI